MWQKMFAPKSSGRHLPTSHDFALVMAKDATKWERNLQPRISFQDDRYKNSDNDPRGVWISDQLTARNYYSRGLYSVTSPSGHVTEGPPKGRFSAVSLKTSRRWTKTIASGGARAEQGCLGSSDFSSTYKRVLCRRPSGPIQKRVIRKRQKELLANSLLTNEVFQTPKPENSLRRFLKSQRVKATSFSTLSLARAQPTRLPRKWAVAGS